MFSTRSGDEGRMPLELARTPELTREQLAQLLRNADVADDRLRDHVRIITGPQPYRHDHYSADQFYRVDAAAGTVHNTYGQRVLRVTLNFVRTLAKALAEQTPDKAKATMYQIGRSWGEANIR